MMIRLSRFNLKRTTTWEIMIINLNLSRLVVCAFFWLSRGSTLDSTLGLFLDIKIFSNYSFLHFDLPFFHHRRRLREIRWRILTTLSTFKLEKWFFKTKTKSTQCFIEIFIKDAKWGFFRQKNQLFVEIMNNPWKQTNFGLLPCFLEGTNGTTTTFVAKRFNWNRLSAFLTQIVTLQLSFGCFYLEL